MVSTFTSTKISFQLEKIVSLSIIHLNNASFQIRMTCISIILQLVKRQPFNVGVGTKQHAYFLICLHVLQNYKKQTLSKIYDHGMLQNRILMYMDNVFVDFNVTNF